MFDTVEDAIALADSPNTANPCQLTPQELSLLLGVMLEIVYPLTNFPLDATILDGRKRSKGSGRDFNTVGQSPSFRLASSQGIVLPRLASLMP